MTQFHLYVESKQTKLKYRTKNIWLLPEECKMVKEVYQEVQMSSYKVPEM